jgi:putative AdoMet-dependent methyltransferase
MVELASRKMPGAHLYYGDFTKGLVEPLCDMKYDFIVATYSLHHLTDEQKILLISELLSLLKEDGMILIGDVAFPDGKAMDECRAKAGDEWDDEEYYFLADEMRKVFPGLNFEKKSHCAGVIVIAGNMDTENYR